MKKIIAILTFLFFGCPWSMAPAAPFMYVPAGDGGEILVIDLHDHRIPRRIAGLAGTTTLAGQPHIPHLVAGGGNFVSIMDRRRDRIMQHIAVSGPIRHTALSPDGRQAVVVHPEDGAVSVIDMDDMEVLKTVATGEGAAFAIFSHRGRRLYVSNEAAGTISIVDSRRWTVEGAIDTGGTPGRLVLSRDGRRLYATDADDRRVVEVTLPLAGIRNRIAVGGVPRDIAVSGDRRWLFVTLPEKNRLLRIDLESGARRSITLKEKPSLLALVETVDRLYVSSEAHPLLLALDPSGLDVTETIDLGSGPAQALLVIDDR